MSEESPFKQPDWSNVQRALVIMAHPDDPDFSCAGMATQMARQGIEALLRRYVPRGDRVLGIDEDGEFEGWHTHLTLLQALRRHGRVLRLL